MSELCLLTAVSLATVQSNAIHQLTDTISGGVVQADHEVYPPEEDCAESQVSSTPPLQNVASVEDSAQPEFSPLQSRTSRVEQLNAPLVEEQASPRPASSLQDQKPVPLPEPSVPLDPSPAETTPSSIQPHPADLLARTYVPPTKAVRPSSGRQFFRQRQTALQSGQSYTRIAADSFSEYWLHSTYEPSHEDWLALLSREAEAMARGQGNNRLTVMVGDSISLWFPTEYMPRYRFWLNQSISGDTAVGTLQRLSLFEKTNPDIIHVMIGINDLRQGVTDQQLLTTQGQIIRRLRWQHPQAQVIVHSLLPTRLESLPSDRIRRINSQMGAIATQEGAQVLDLHRYFTDESGQLNATLTTDGLHLNGEGYALWYSILSQMSLT